MSDKHCPTQNNLEIFLSSEMPPKEKEIFQLHLADCADCRRNLVAVFVAKAEETETFKTPKSLTETVKNLPASESKANSVSFFSFDWLKKYRLQTAFAAVLLVCFGFVGFYFLQNRQTSDADDVLRNGAANKNLIKLLAPEDNANIQAENIEFRWSEMQSAKNYTLVISDEKGDIFKEIPTQLTQIETTISALGLTNGKAYFWHVKAKLADGLTSESETRKISAK